MPDLVDALILLALMGATLQYAILLRHREEQRDAVRLQADVRESLMSVGRVDTLAPVRRWTDDGTRFRVPR